MTRQERILLEYSKFQKPVYRIDDPMEQLKRFGVINFTTDSDEHSKEDEIKDFISFIKQKGLKFKDADIKKSNILGKPFLDFKGHSKLLDGDFQRDKIIVTLRDKSQILGGNYRKVKLYEESMIISCKIIGQCYLNDNSSIYNKFQGKIKSVLLSIEKYYRWKGNLDTLIYIKKHWGGLYVALGNILDEYPVDKFDALFDNEFINLNKFKGKV